MQWEWRDDGWGEYRECVAYGTVNHVHSFSENHHAHVAEVEAWGLPPGMADDGLDDAYEMLWWYRQTASVASLPLAILNDGGSILVLLLERPTWAGVDTRALLSLEVQHGGVGEMAVAVGAWTGAVWDDRLVWIPGGFANNSIWDSPAINHTHSSLVCTEWEWRDDGFGEYRECVAYEVRTSTHVHYYESSVVPAGTASLSRTMTESPTTAASSVEGTTSRVTIDLMKAVLEGWEQEAGFRAPSFPLSSIQGASAWRVLVRDWYPYGHSGSLLAAEIVTEVRSDKTLADTDGDGLLDGDDVALGVFPVAADTDWDGLTDLFEKDPRSLTLTVDGTTSTRTVWTNPANADTDNDGLKDGEERSLGIDLVITDPTLEFTDADGLRDGEEFFLHRSNATRTDTDGDTLSDSLEVVPRPLSLTVNGVSHTRSVATLAYAIDSDGDGLRDDAEWTGSTPTGVVTDPSDSDTDDDGMMDLELWIVYAIRGLSQLDSVLTAIEGGQPLKYWEPLIRDYITLYTEYVVIASPLSSDTDGDGLSDGIEYFLHSDPRNVDTDQDHLADGMDDDPTTVELERPLIFIDTIWCCEYFPDWQLKRYRITYSVYDTAGLDVAVIYKDGNYGSPVQTHHLNGVTSSTFTDNFDIGWGDAFDGARWEIYATDLNGNVDYISLQQPTIFDAVGNFLTSATVTTLGPSDGGKLSGGWYAFRDTVVDLATLFLNPGALFDGGRAVGDAFQEQGIGALVELGTALYEFIDATQEEANPYAAGTAEHAIFRYNWYAGYIATTIGLSLLGAAAAKAVVEGIKASQVLSRIGSTLADLGDTAKVAQYVARLKGIGIVNSRILIGAVFTTAFAAAAYVWPEIFGAWFSNYMGGAVVFVSLYSLGPFGFADDVLKKAPRVVTKAGLNDVDGFVKRLDGQFGKEVTERAVRDLDGLVGLPGYERLVRNIDTSNNLGFVHEARVAAHHGASNIEELERKVRTPVGETDLDVLLRNGDIIEAKYKDLSAAYLSSPEYADFVGDLEKQLQVLQAWRASTSRGGANIVAFRITPHPDILKWLSDHGFGWEVVP